ncbi:hypothetical protein B0H17DRAFT_1028498 [Mycena rosella]|uniref:F-box domain-containing protein n=1 Tax=Mycena rosella TaxID=1033263 RepID=A0AAD7H199_MYCRO|nr:hypothetical protein B0H17DRAFT_1028498 [Mycena rosella]
MPLLDLPTELIQLIFLSLLPNADSLDALCLVHRRLLAVARPLTWHELILDGTFGAEKSPREERFLEFVSDDARAAGVRRLVLSGEVLPAGIKLLSKLPNVTHMKILGAWMEPEDWYDGFHMIHGLIGSFPALDAVHLRDCLVEDEDFDEFRDELQHDNDEAGRNAYIPDDEVLSHSLRRILCENVDPAMRKLWLSTPNVEVVEMHVCSAGPVHSYRQAGVHRMLLRDPNFCEKVKRIHVEYCLVPDEQLDDDEDEELEEEEIADAANITNFFRWRAHTLPSLQDLVLEIPFQLAHLQKILPALPELCPNLKRLKFQISPGGCKDFFDLEHVVQNPDRFRLSRAEFRCLEELKLPFSGLRCDLLVALPCMLLNAPKLAHLYLGNPHILGADKFSVSSLVECVDSYAALVPTLQSVSWDRAATFIIKRDGAATRCYKENAREPAWEKQQAFGGWY